MSDLTPRRESVRRSFGEELAQIQDNDPRTKVVEGLGVCPQPE